MRSGRRIITWHVWTYRSGFHPAHRLQQAWLRHHSRSRSAPGGIGMSYRALFCRLGACMAGLAVLVAPYPAGAADDMAADGATLAAPAVVWLRTSVNAQVVVIEHRRDVTLFAKSYTVPVASGSGVVVSPDGAIATAARVTTPELASVKIYAINKAFAETYGIRIVDPFRRQHVPDRDLDRRLHLCYAQGRHSSCIFTKLAPVVEVFPYAQPPFAKGLVGQVLSVRAAPKGIAVVQVTGPTNMPTAALVPAGGDMEHLTVLGFSKPPTGSSSPTRVDAGAGKLGGLRLLAGLSGGPVVDDRGRLAGLVSAQAPDGSGPAIFHKADDVAAALKAVGVQPHQGVVDSTFQEAMRYYTDRHYGHAVERFKAVTAYYPKHALAVRLLADAQRRAGGPEDMSAAMNEHGTPTNKTRVSPFWWMITAIVLFLVLGTVAWVWRRRPIHLSPTPQPPPEAARPPTAAQTPSTADEVSTLGLERGPSGSDQSDVGNGIGRIGGKRAAEPVGPVRAPTSREGTAETSVQDRPATPAPTSDKLAFCTQCGKPANPGYRYCGHCGHRLN
jgi:hypothetical protein